MHDRLVVTVGGVCTLTVAGIADVAIGNIYADAKAIDLIGQLSRPLSAWDGDCDVLGDHAGVMLTALGMTNRAEAEQVNIDTSMRTRRTEKPRRSLPRGLSEYSRIAINI